MIGMGVIDSNDIELLRSGIFLCGEGILGINPVAVVFAENAIASRGAIAHFLNLWCPGIGCLPDLHHRFVESSCQIVKFAQQESAALFWIRLLSVLLNNLQLFG